MSDHEIKVKVNLDDSEAQKKLNDLTKKERKIDIDVDTSDIDQASKKVDDLKNKNIKVDAKVTGKETIDSTAKSMDKAKKSASGFGNTIKGFAKFGVYLEVFQLIKQGAQEAVQAIKEIDDAIVDLQMATGDSYANVRQLVSGYNELAKNLGATTTEMTRGADTWLRQGKSISETNQLLQDTMVLSKVAQIDSDDSSSYLTAIMKGYKMAANEVEGINDSLTSIDLAAAVDAGGLAEATSRVAASADLAGVSLNRLLGYEAAVGEASQESMSVIGNAFKSIFSRMSNIKAGNLELIDEDGTTQTLSDVETVFTNIGVPLRNSTNEFRDFGDVLDDVAAKWSNLSSVQQAAVSQSLGGVYQSNRVRLLFENYDKALQYEQIAENSSGTAEAKFQDAYLNSIEAKTKSLQASFEGLSSNLISRDTINGILEATQALVEFLDKTNLVKGVLAGIAVGGALKGFSLISAGIVKATADITSFGDAAKSAFSTLKANPIGVISTIIGLATAAWSSYNQAVEESIQKAKDITSSWSESNTSLNEQISKYKELKSQLDSGSLTSSEEYSIRQQILDIQSQITSQYGEQAANIDLVNGSLTTQLGLLQQISAENAKSTLNESREEYQNAKKNMEEDRSYNLGSMDINSDDQLNKDIKGIVSEFEDNGLSLTEMGGGGQKLTVLFRGDATQANQSINDFMNRIEELKSEYSDDDQAIGVLDSILDQASSSLNENQQVLDDYQESYKSFLQMDMVSKGTGEGSVADTFNKYTEAVSSYNEALASGDSDAINKARANFNELDSDVDYLLSKDDNQRFTFLFEDVANQLDEASVKANDFKEALTGTVGDNNTFKKTSDDIKSASDALKDMRLDAVDAIDALLTKGNQKGENQLWKLAYDWGITSESSEEEIRAFVDILSQAGIVSGQVADSVETASSSFDTYSSSVAQATENLAALQTIMAESVSGGGISADNVDAFKEMFGDDAEKALEKTANGYHINKEALAELQGQQQTTTKSDYLSALSDQYELLRENTEKLAKAQFMGEDTSGLEATRQGILDQISSLQDLQYQYESATSAYQQWQSAMSGGEEGDMYDSIYGNLESVQELYDQGLTGTNKFREFTDLMSNQDLSTASTDEIVAAYEDVIPKIERYFTEGQEGAQRFLSDIQNINSEWAHMNEDGSWDIDFGEGNDQDIADALGIDVEAVQAVMRKLSDYGFDINLDQPVESLEELKTSAQSAQEALNSMQDTSLSDINLDSSSFAEITDDISQVEEYIDDLNDDNTIEPDVKTEKLENANAILEYLVQLQNDAGSKDVEISVNSEELETKIKDAKAALDEFKNDSGQVDLSVSGAQEAVDNLQTLLYQKEELNAPAVMDVDTSQVDGEIGNAISKLQEFQQAAQNLEVQTELKSQGVDIDTSEAQAKVDSLAAEIQGINPDIAAKLDIDTTSVSTIQSSLQALTPEVMVKAGVDDSAVTAFTSTEKQAQGKVTWTNNSAIVDFYAATKKTASGVVNWSNNTANVKTHFTATGTISWSGSGGNSPYQGTAHANGSTVKSYQFNNWKGQANASGDWGIKQGDTSLVGELGQEILVRDSKFYTIGDTGAEFIQTKPGDIIFNHKQTASLLKNGYVTSRGKMIGGNSSANGTAYSSGSGKFNVGGSGSQASSGFGSSNKSSGGSTANSVAKAATSAANAASSAASSAAKAADEFKEKFDEVEIWLDRFDRTLNNLTDSIETYSYDLSKQSSVSDQAMNHIRNNLSTLQSAYNRYIQEANSVGLDESWAAKVRNGAINLEDITNEDLKEKIDDYQSYYEKALDVQDTIAELQRELVDLATEKLDNIEQYYENRSDYDDNFGYLTSIEQLATALETYQKELDKQVNDGIIKEFSNEWYEAQSSIAEMQQNLFEAMLKKYQDIVDNLDRISTTLDNSLSLKEARDEPITEEDYQRPLEVANEQIDSLFEKRQKLLEQQAIYDVGSELYDDIADQISDIDDDIYGLLEDIEDLKDKIWEVRWQPFFDGQEALEDLRDETEDFRDLLHDDAFIGEFGGLTTEGLTNVALISQAMNAAKQSIRNYQEAIKKLTEDYEAGNISTNEYEENLSDFLANIRDGVSNVEDFRMEIVDLYTEMLERENEVTQESIKKFSELLDVRKKNDDYAKDIRNQTKDINALEAQIKALESVNNESAKAELKRLKQELNEQQQSLKDMQSDREYDIRSQGYDYLSEDLDNQLEDTLNSVKYNASEQERVISEMLNHVLDNYKTVYGHINDIIANTGFTPSGDFQQNIDNLGSQAGAQGQTDASNTIAPDYTPDDFVGGINTGQIQTDKDQSKNDAIESEIEKEPNIDNRPVALIELKPTSLTLEEGKSGTITANVRPTDAANKTLSWTSSNTSVATVSGGTVKAIKPGSATITCSATDGSGKSASASVTVTKKPDPPKPAPSGGDGVLRVGDRVTFTGQYYYSSWGVRPVGSLYSGVPNGVIVDSYSSSKYGGSARFTGGYDVHIKSADGRYGDLGWVSIGQLSGYKEGTLGVDHDQLAKVNEAGKEMIIRAGGSQIAHLQYGDSVLPHSLSENLFTLSSNTHAIMNNLARSTPDGSQSEVVINNNYESLLTVNGDIDKDTFPGVKKMCEQAYQYTSKKMYQDAGLMGIRKKL